MRGEGKKGEWRTNEESEKTAREKTSVYVYLSVLSKLAFVQLFCLHGICRLFIVVGAACRRKS